MQNITLPGKNEGTRVQGGVVFTDGTAQANLGPNKRRYFESIGATVTELAQVGRKSVPLDKLKLSELTAYADKQGIDLSGVPRKKDDTLAAIEAGLAAKAADTQVAVQQVNAETFAAALATSQTESNTVHTGPGEASNADTGSVDNAANTAVAPNGPAS